jgi:RNA polymerase sigma-70 factor (ECF subfamily)
MALSPALSRTGALTAEELCQRYSASVCRFAALVSRNNAEAEDLAQDALLKAVRAVGSYDPSRGAPEAWLWGIVVNASRDAGRRHERSRWLLERLRLAAVRESESPEALALDRLRDSDLHRELRRLPQRDRTLLALRYGVGLETSEVGTAVGLGTESAGKAIRRALARLRARLEDMS